MRVYVVCAGRGAEPGCALPTVCLGSSPVTPVPVISFGLETWAHLPGKLGVTEMVAQGSCVPPSW